MDFEKLQKPSNGFIDVLLFNEISTALCSISKNSQGRIKVKPSEAIEHLNSLVDKQIFKGHFIDFLNERIYNDLKFLSECR